MGRDGAWRTIVHDHSFIHVLSIKNPDFTQEERGTFGEGQERAIFKTNCLSACFKVAAGNY